MKPTDTELLNALESFINNEPLLLWKGDGEYPLRMAGPDAASRCVGLSLLGGRRTLREAIGQLIEGPK